MGRITQNAIALRIARRSVKRNRLQSALIIAIIALPMALAGFALTYVESTRPTGPELVKYQLGLAQARYQLAGPANPKAEQAPTGETLAYPYCEGVSCVESEQLTLGEVLPDLPLIEINRTNTKFNTATGVGYIDVVVGEVWNSALLGKGPTDLIDGRIPSLLSEALISQDALERFGIKIGGRIETAAGQIFTVTGVLQDSSRRLGEDVVYVKSGAIAVPEETPSRAFYYQVEGDAPTWSQVQAFNKLGVVVVSREVLLNPPPTNQTEGQFADSIRTVIASLTLAPLVLMPIAVLAGSAFAFGARRQTRTLAVLSSLGANRALLRKVTLASGVWLGTLGGAIGLVVGVSLAWALGPIVAKALSRDGHWSSYPGFHLPYTLLFIALFIGAALGAITSLVPAIRASKVNVLASLRGSRTEGVIRARTGVGALVVLIVGVASIGASLAILLSSNSLPIDAYQTRTFMQLAGVLVGIGGAIVTIVAFMVGTGWILRAVRWVMSRFGSTANYAGKDLLYNRKRYAPVIASVLAVTFVATFVASFFYGSTKFNLDNYSYRYLPGQAGLQSFMSPKDYDLSNPNPEPTTVENFWAGGPDLDYVKSENELIKQTNAFDSVTIIDSTVDVYNAAGTMNTDGTVAEQFDIPTPYVVYNPANACYFTSLSEGSQEWLASHAAGMTSKDRDEPKGCSAIEDPSRSIVVGDVKELRAVINRKDSRAEETLMSGGVVVFNKLYDYAGEAKVSWIKPSEYSWFNRKLDAATKTTTFDSYLVSDIKSPSFIYSAMVSRETAADLGLRTFPLSTVVTYSGEIPISVTDDLNGKNIFIDYSNGTGNLNPETFAWVIILLASLFSLASTGIALGLSQIEARTDKRTLSAIGAPRSFRARLVASQALALTLTGSLLGALTGLMLGAAMLNGMDSAMAQFPWVQLETLVLGVPAVAALAFWLFTPRSLKYEVRQALD